MLSRVQAFWRNALLACALAVSSLAQQSDSLESALAALQRGDYSSAQQILEEHLRLQPADGPALGVLGVVLDQQKKYVAAEVAYRKALANSAPDPALLNNFGNHLLATGKLAEARKTFLAVIHIDGSNGNALVQLARIALESKEPAQALSYLHRLPQASEVRPDAAVLRMQAEYASGNQRGGDAALAGLASAAGADPGQSLALGVALASARQYEKAEAFFSKTLEAKPGDFEALYDLGLAASHAGHNERARAVLQQALAQQPENIDVLYDLAVVNVDLDAKESALALLAQASQRAPQRTDILQLEARTAAALGYFADAEHAWDSYLKLVPANDVAQRERAFAQTAIGQKTADGLAALNAFVHKHPADAMGHYELGIADTPGQPAEALKELNRALSLKPALGGAHVARGLLLYRQGKLAEALSDFQLAVQADPHNGIILDRLGETYLVLDRTSEALPVLRKAAELLPSNATVLLHLGRALSKAGQREEASAVFARCRALGPNRAASPHAAGLIEFLGLSPEEQKAKFRAGVARTIQTSPGNAEAQVRYLGILLEDGRVGDAAAVVRTLVSLKLDGPLLGEAAHLLLAAKAYSLLQQLLEPVPVDPAELLAFPELMLDLALADLNVTGAQAASNILDRLPQSQRNGDYSLVRAQIFAAQNRPDDAVRAIDEATLARPTRSDLLFKAALLLIQKQRLPKAIQLLAQAERIAPNDPELSLLQAVASELSGDRKSSDASFQQLETRWPDWYKIWLTQSLILQARGQQEQAQSMRDAAVALDAPAELMRLGEQHPFTAQDLTGALPVLFS